MIITSGIFYAQELERKKLSLLVVFYQISVNNKKECKNNCDFKITRSKRCKREISKQKSMDTQYPFVGAAVGIVLSTLAVVADFIVYGTASLVAHPILKGFTNIFSNYFYRMS